MLESVFRYEIEGLERRTELRYCKIGAVPTVPMLKMGHVDS
jgi:hypothetical protein